MNEQTDGQAGLVVWRVYIGGTEAELGSFLGRRWVRRRRRLEEEEIQWMI